MKIKLRNNKEVSVSNKEDIIAYIFDSLYPASDAVNALSENIISKNEFQGINKYLLNSGQQCVILESQHKGGDLFERKAFDKDTLRRYAFCH